MADVGAGGPSSSLCPLSHKLPVPAGGVEDHLVVLAHLQKPQPCPRLPARCLLSFRLPAFSPGWGLKMPGQECQLCGEGGGWPPGARGSRRTLCSLPWEHCGQLAEWGSGLGRLQQTGPALEGPAHRRPCLPARAVLPTGQMDKLRLREDREGQQQSRA